MDNNSTHHKDVQAQEAFAMAIVDFIGEQVNTNPNLCIICASIEVMKAAIIADIKNDGRNASPLKISSLFMRIASEIIEAVSGQPVAVIIEEFTNQEEAEENHHDHPLHS